MHDSVPRCGLFTMAEPTVLTISSVGLSEKSPVRTNFPSPLGGLGQVCEWQFPNESHCLGAELGLVPGAFARPRRRPGA